MRTTRPGPRGRAVVVVGASSRAWGASAARGGWSVHAVDLFADTDLVALARSAIRLAEGFPVALPVAVAGLPAGPVTYTGGLENHPAVLAALARSRPLAGVPPEALPAVRTPGGVARLARAAGMIFPDTRPSARGLPHDGTWLIKPLAGAGGTGIEPWRGPAAPRRGRDCWQRRMTGRPWGATYLIAPSGPRLVGIARQQLGAVRRGAAPFAWRGGITGAIPRLPAAVRTALARLGEALWQTAGVRGVVGADFLVTPAGDPLLIEINPRPTASAELHERRDGRSLAAEHLQCFGHEPPARTAGPDGRDGVWAKALIRSPAACRADDRLVDGIRTLAERWTRLDGDWPALADIPAAGAELPDHGPLLSVFAHGPRTADTTQTLTARSRAVRELLRAWLRRRDAVPTRRPRRSPGTASDTRLRSSPDRSP